MVVCENLGLWWVAENSFIPTLSHQLMMLFNPNYLPTASLLIRPAAGRDRSPRPKYWEKQNEKWGIHILILLRRTKWILQNTKRTLLPNYNEILWLFITLNNGRCCNWSNNLFFSGLLLERFIVLLILWILLVVVFILQVYCILVERWKGWVIQRFLFLVSNME